MSLIHPIFLMKTFEADNKSPEMKTQCQHFLINDMHILTYLSLQMQGSRVPIHQLHIPTGKQYVSVDALCKHAHALCRDF